MVLKNNRERGRRDGMRSDLRLLLGDWTIMCPKGPVFAWVPEGKGWVKKSLKYHRYPPEGTAL